MREEVAANVRVGIDNDVWQQRGLRAQHDMLADDDVRADVSVRTDPGSGSDDGGRVDSAGIVRRLVQEIERPRKREVWIRDAERRSRDRPKGGFNQHRGGLRATR